MQTTLQEPLAPLPALSKETIPPLTLAASVRECLLFFRRPVPGPWPEELPAAQRWKFFGYLFLIKLLAALGAGLLCFGLIRLLGYDPFKNHAVEKFLRETPLVTALLLVALLGPVVEEFFFRYPLRFGRRRVPVALAGFCIFCLPPLLDWLGTSTLVNLGLAAGALALAIGFLLSESWGNHLELFWQRHFGAMFYTFSGAFALIHLANFEQLKLPLALVPLLVVPQLVAGLFWGYLRLRLRLKWAMLAHGLYNAVVVLLSYLITFS